MLYIIGLGLNENGISKQGLLALEKCHKVYLESYTVDFPYKIEDLHLGKKNIVKLRREDVESNKLIKEAKSRDIALLVYGSPLFATTHLTLLLDAREQEVEVKVIYSASVFDSIGETGLQLYKFGKIASMPDWFSHTNKPMSFIEIIKENQSIKAHSLLLIDIGLSFGRAIQQLQEATDEKELKLDKLIICSRLGTDEQEIFYDSVENLKNQKVRQPFCFIIPSELHFLEQKGIEGIKALNRNISK